VRIEILDTAQRDLVEGFRFYEEQGVGLGSYFLTSLYADIESLRVYGAFTASLTNTITAFSPGASLSRYFIRSRKMCLP
jgi:hypothetical protein